MNEEHSPEWLVQINAHESHGHQRVPNLQTSGVWSKHPVYERDMETGLCQNRGEPLPFRSTKHTRTHTHTHKCIYIYTHIYIHIKIRMGMCQNRGVATMVAFLLVSLWSPPGKDTLTKHTCKDLNARARTLASRASVKAALVCLTGSRPVW